MEMVRCAYGETIPESLSRDSEAPYSSSGRREGGVTASLDGFSFGGLAGGVADSGGPPTGTQPMTVAHT